MAYQAKGGTPAEDVMAEDNESPKMQSQNEEATETAELPLSMFAGKSVKEGDVFEFKVVSVDQEGGAVTVVYNTGDSGKGEYGGSDDMAAQFDKPMMKGQI